MDQSGRSLRGAVGAAAPAGVGPARRAPLQPTRRRAADGRIPAAGQPAAADQRTPAGDGAPRNRREGAVHQPGLSQAHRRRQRARKPGAAGIPVGTRGEPRVHGALQVGTRQHRLLGQPFDRAPAAQGHLRARLRSPALPRHAARRGAGGGGRPAFDRHRRRPGAGGAFGCLSRGGLARPPKKKPPAHAGGSWGTGAARAAPGRISLAGGACRRPARWRASAASPIRTGWAPRRRRPGSPWRHPVAAPDARPGGPPRRGAETALRSHS